MLRLVAQRAGCRLEEMDQQPMRDRKRDRDLDVNGENETMLGTRWFIGAAISAFENTSRSITWHQ